MSINDVKHNYNYMIFLGTGSGKGGWNDFYCFAETLEEAYKVTLNQNLLYDWIHIVNNLNGEIAYKKIRVQQTKCRGCIEHQPNQMAHMDYGGCLYSRL